MIKNIIFDYGGVIINIDYDRAFAAFKRLGAASLEHFFSKAHQMESCQLFEKGLLTAADFRQIAKEALHIEQASDAEFDEAWNALLMDLPEERLDFINQIRQKSYRTFLLSNVNEIHLEAANAVLKRDVPRLHFENYFDQIYYSHEIGERKPDAAAFLKVLNDHDLAPAETLFIDDTQQHIESAKKLGLQTHLLTSNAGFKNLSYLLK